MDDSITPKRSLVYREQAQRGWRGLITVTAVYKDGTRHVDRFPNIITYDGLDLMAQAFKGDVTSPYIRYVALGDSSTAESQSQHQLGSEKYRQQITSRSYPGGTHGQLLSSVSISSFDANDFTIEEIGWFAGPTASSAANSGVMMARVTWHHAKNDLESLKIERTDIWTYSAT